MLKAAGVQGEERTGDPPLLTRFQVCCAALLKHTAPLYGTYGTSIDHQTKRAEKGYRTDTVFLIISAIIQPENDILMTEK